MSTRCFSAIVCTGLFAISLITHAQEEGEQPECPALGKSELLVQLPEICPTLHTSAKP